LKLIINEKHNIITSQTIKHTLNGYRLITIQNVDTDNNTLKYNDYLNIIFENIHIKITPIIDNMDDISSKLDIMITNFSSKESDDVINYAYKYDKNILKNNIVSRN
jgi:hypothetical protein